MSFVDVHCHLDQFKEDEVKRIIEECLKSEVKVIINNGVDYKTNRESLKLSKKHSIVKAALGLHPEFIKKFSEDDIRKELSFIEKNKDKIIAVGEVGLDFYWIKDEKIRRRQEEMFRKFIRLSVKIDKPLIVHSRGAEEETINVLIEEGAEKVVLHSFSGKLKLLKKLNSKWMLSIPPVIVRSSHFQELVKRISLNNLLTETDSPFLSPSKYEKNKPSNVTLTVEKIAEIKSLERKEVENNIFMNYQRMFS